MGGKSWKETARWKDHLERFFISQSPGQQGMQRDQCHLVLALINTCVSMPFLPSFTTLWYQMDRQDAKLLSARGGLIISALKVGRLFRCSQFVYSCSKFRCFQTLSCLNNPLFKEVLTEMPSKQNKEEVLLLLHLGARPSHCLYPPVVFVATGGFIDHLGLCHSQCEIAA